MPGRDTSSVAAAPAAAVAVAASPQPGTPRLARRSPVASSAHKATSATPRTPLPRFRIVLRLLQPCDRERGSRDRADTEKRRGPLRDVFQPLGRGVDATAPNGSRTAKVADDDGFAAAGGDVALPDSLDARANLIRIEWADHPAEVTSSSARQPGPRRASGEAGEQGNMDGGDGGDFSKSRADRTAEDGRFDGSDSAVVRGGDASTAVPPEKHAESRLTAASPSTTSTPVRRPLVDAPSAPLARFEKTSSFRVGGEDEAAEAGRDELGAAAAASRASAFDTGSVEVAFGVVHLYREEEQTAAPLTDVGRASAEASGSASATTRTTVLGDEGDDFGTILAVLAVPSTMSASRFLAFVEPALEAISNVRIIRESSPGRCLVLLKLRDALDAEEFHKMYNGRPFDAMHPEEICQVVYVTSVTVASASSLPRYPLLTNADPWPLPDPTAAAPSSAAGGGARLTELPTCPVCLDRMDSSVTGLLTVTCQHTFHCSCLSRWEDSRCPVCRYSQGRLTSRRGGGGANRRSVLSASAAARERAARARGQATDGGPSGETSGARGQALADVEDEDDEDAAASRCAVCQTQQDLWICLICAAVGCGRYKGGHAHRHFEQTDHAYSLELETQRVWSYVEDTYVHRLIQSKADGQLVELPSASSARSTPDRRRRARGPPTGQSAPGGGKTIEDDAHGLGGASDGAGAVFEDEEAEDEDEAAATLDKKSKAASSSAWDSGAGVGGKYTGDGRRGGEDKKGKQALAAAEEELEALEIEYSHLLASQLDSQRAFYEDQVWGLQSKLAEALRAVDEAHTATEAERRGLAERERRLADERNERESQRAALERAERKLERATELARRLEREVQAERSVAQALLRKLDARDKAQDATRAELDALKAQNADLQEHMRDLMFYVSARDKIQEQGGEAAGGDIERVAAAPKSRSGASRKKKKNANAQANAASAGATAAATTAASSADNVTAEQGPNDAGGAERSHIK